MEPECVISKHVRRKKRIRCEKPQIVQKKTRKGKNKRKIWTD